VTTTGNDTVTTTIANIAATAAVNAGVGTDTLALSIVATTGADGQVTAAELANFVGFETLTLANRTSITGSNVNYDITVADANIASGATLTVTSSEDGVNADGSLAAPGVNFSGAGLTGDRKLNFTGAAAQDSITGGAGNDTINGGDGNDTIVGGAGTNILSGGNGDDTITSGSLTDSIDGGAGNDTVTLVTGAYTSVIGGSTGAADILSVVNATNIAAATVSGFENLTIATGGSTTMTVAQLAGFTGTVIAAGTSGGANPETIVLTGAGGTVAKPAAVEVINGSALTSASTFTATAAANTSITGASAFANTITVTGDVASVVLLVGGTGNDVISLAHGAAGTFTNDDTITGGTGTDTFNITGDIALTITLDADFTGIDVLNIGQTTAAVSITTVAANITTTDTLTVTSSQTTGALTFSAAAEDGTADTGVGLVSVTGGGGNDVITGTAQADTLSGGNGDDNLTGGGGIDSLLGGDGGDTISGGAGADIINAGSGNNVVDGGLGIDTIALGTGSSSVVISNGAFDTTSAADVVTGFTSGTLANGGDVVRLGIGDLDAGAGATITLTGQAGDIAAAAAAVLHTVAPGAAAAFTAGANLIFVSGTTGTAFTSALNGASVTGSTASAAYAVVYYDADLNGGSMVVSAVSNTGGDTVIDAGDAAREIILLTAAMSAVEYAALAAVNFTFA